MVGLLLDQGIQDLAQGNRLVRGILDQGIRGFGQGNHLVLGILDQEIQVHVQGSSASHHRVEMGKID